MKGRFQEYWSHMILVVMIGLLTIGLLVTVIRNASLQNEAIPYSISLYANSLATVESGEVSMEFKKPLDVEIKEIGKPDRYETLIRVLKRKGYGVATKPLEGKRSRFFFIYADTEPVRFTQVGGIHIVKSEKGTVYIREGGLE